MRFFYCFLYLLSISVIIYVCGRLFPRKWIRENKFPFSCRKFEKNGKIYEKIKIRKWKTKYPDASLIMHKIFKKIPKKRMDLRAELKLPVLIKESCVAEATHTVAAILGFGCVFIWKKCGIFIAIAYALANLPAIFIQRYNRPRYAQNLSKLTAPQIA